MNGEVDAAIINSVVGVGGFISGFFVSRFTLSKADRKAIEQRNYENSREHRSAMELRCQEFKNALASYVAKEEPPSLDDFMSITKAGELYFGELRAIADAILSDKADPNTRDNTFVPTIIEALQKNVPVYYEQLAKIALKVGAEYTGEFKRENYESLFVVAEKYGKGRTPVFRR